MQPIAALFATALETIDQTFVTTAASADAAFAAAETAANGAFTGAAEGYLTTYIGQYTTAYAAHANALNTAGATYTQAIAGARVDYQQAVDQAQAAANDTIDAANDAYRDAALAARDAFDQSIEPIVDAARDDVRNAFAAYVTAQAFYHDTHQLAPWQQAQKDLIVALLGIQSQLISDSGAAFIQFITQEQDAMTQRVSDVAEARHQLVLDMATAVHTAADAITSANQSYDDAGASAAAAQDAALIAADSSLTTSLASGEFQLATSLASAASSHDSTEITAASAHDNGQLSALESAWAAVEAAIAAQSSSNIPTPIWQGGGSYLPGALRAVINASASRALTITSAKQALAIGLAGAEQQLEMAMNAAEVARSTAQSQINQASANRRSAAEKNYARTTNALDEQATIDAVAADVDYATTAADVVKAWNTSAAAQLVADMVAGIQQSLAEVSARPPEEFSTTQLMYTWAITRFHVEIGGESSTSGGATGAGGSSEGGGGESGDNAGESDPDPFQGAPLDDSGESPEGTAAPTAAANAAGGGENDEGPAEGGINYDVDSMPKPVMDQLVADGLARRFSAGLDEFVIVDTSVGKLAYRHDMQLLYNDQGLVVGRASAGSYSLCGRFPRTMSDGAIVDILKAQDQIDLANLVSGTLSIALNILPGGGTADSIAEGDTTGAITSGVADSLLVVGAFAKALKWGPKAVLAISAVEVGVDAGVGTYNAIQAVKITIDPNANTGDAAGPAAEALLRLVSAALAGRSVNSSYEQLRQQQLSQLAGMIDTLKAKRVEAARKYALGVDPAIGGKHRPAEQATAELLEARLKRRLERFQGDGADWIDPGNGYTYDAVGTGVTAQSYNRGSLVNQIRKHLDTKGLNFTVVDLSGLSYEQSQEILDYVMNQCSAADRAKIILLGL